MAFDTNNYLPKLKQLTEATKFAPKKSGVGSTLAGRAGSASRARTAKMIGLGQQAASQTTALAESSARGVRRMFDQVDVDREEQDSDVENAAWIQAIEESLAETKAELKDTEEGPPLTDPDVNYEGDIVGFIAGLEGFRENAYEDYGQISIGFGTKAKNLGQTITREEAMKALTKEVMEARTIVLGAVKKHGYDWSENQIDALTSFTYNLGPGGFNKLIQGGKRGDEEISEMILEYNKAGGKVLEGLVKRRQAEANLFTHGYTR